MKRLRCEFALVKNETHAVTIRDLNNGAMSVTNDAQSVVKHLRVDGCLRKGKRLFYYDSDGQLDEIIWTEDGKIDFRVLSISERNELDGYKPTLGVDKPPATKEAAQSFLDGLLKNRPAWSVHWASEVKTMHTPTEVVKYCQFVMSPFDWMATETEVGERYEGSDLLTVVEAMDVEEQVDVNLFDGTLEIVREK